MKNFSFPIGFQKTHKIHTQVKKDLSLELSSIFTSTGNFVCFLLHSFIYTLIFYRKYHVNEKESMIGFSETLTKSYKPVQNIRSLIATPFQVFKTQYKTLVSVCPPRCHICHDSTCAHQHHQPLQSFFQNALHFVDMYKM